MRSSHFDQFIQYKALAFKFNAMGAHTSEILETAINEAVAKGEPKLKQVCAPLSVELVEQMEEIIGLLGMSKREFIELAVIEACAKARVIMDEVNIWNVHVDEDGDAAPVGAPKGLTTANELGGV
jgi:hypothetical protein